jgi:hypothetical protein
MAREICPGGARCLDLSRPLLELPAAEIDTGYDGSHYGPQVNARIAAAVSDFLNLQPPAR